MTRGKVSSGIGGIGAVGDFNVIKCRGVVKNGAEDEFGTGDRVEVPAEEAIKLGLDYDVQNLKPEYPYPASNWTIGVTVREISPKNEPIDATKDIIVYSPMRGASKRFVNIGAVNEERTFRIKLWANQQGFIMPDDPPQTSW